jgi:acyl-CoA-binding protein
MEPKEAVEVEGTNNSGDPYDEAFNEAAADTPQDKGVGKAEETQVEAEQKVEKKVEEKVEHKAEEKPDHIPKQSYDEVAHKYATLQGMYNQLQKQVKDLEKKSVEPSPKKEEPKPPPLPDLSDMFNHMYDDLDEITKKSLKQYDDEFDTHAKAEDIKRVHALKKVVKAVEERTQRKIEESLTEFAQAVQEYLNPRLKKIEEAATGSVHYNAIKAAHPDFEKYRDDGSLKTWVDEQPSLLKSAYNKVYTGGSADEVIELYTLFKAAKGANNNEAKGKEEKGTGKEEVDQVKMRNLETIKGKTTGVSIASAGGAVDFDAAFDEAMARSQRR